MSKKCEGIIACLCGHNNKVVYNKPNYLTRTVARWECENCWAGIMTNFSKVPGQAREIKQDSYVIKPSDKLNRIQAAKAASLPERPAAKF